MSNSATPSPFSTIDNPKFKNNGSASAAPLMNHSNNASNAQINEENEKIANNKAQANNNSNIDYSAFWASQSKWKADIQASSCTVLITDPQQQARSWSNPNPPIMFLVSVTESQGAGVRRRYSDFEYLRNILISRYCGILVPPLPEKKIMGNKETEFLRNRMRRLGFFLERVVANPYLRMDPVTNAFLTMSDQNAWTEFRKANPIPTEAPVVSATAAVSSIASAAGTSLASMSSSTAALFSSFASASSSKLGLSSSTSAPTAAGTTDTVSTAQTENTAQSFASLLPAFRIIPNEVDRNADDSENRWKAAIVSFVLPANFEKVISDVRTQLDTLDAVMQALVVSSSKILDASNVYSLSIRNFNAQYEKVMKVETTNTSGLSSSSGDDSSQNISTVLQGLGTAFSNWGKNADKDPNIIEQLLHEVLIYELLCIKELKRMLSQRDSIINEKEKVIKSQKGWEAEKETSERTGKQDRTTKAQVKIMECQSLTQKYEFLLDIVNKGLFLDTLQNFTTSKIHMFKDLIGKLGAAKVRQAQEQQIAWMDSIADLQIDFEKASLKAQTTLEQAAKSADQKSEENNDQQQQSTTGPLTI